MQLTHIGIIYATCHPGLQNKLISQIVGENFNASKFCQCMKSNTNGVRIHYDTNKINLSTIHKRFKNVVVALYAENMAGMEETVDLCGLRAHDYKQDPEFLNDVVCMLLRSKTLKKINIDVESLRWRISAKFLSKSPAFSPSLDFEKKYETGNLDEFVTGLKNNSHVVSVLFSFEALVL